MKVNYPDVQVEMQYATNQKIQTVHKHNYITYKEAIILY
jgi:hypothetical protein